MSPLALPYGTRAEAMPPRHAPRKNGVTIDARAETASRSRTCHGRDVPADTAYAAPRTTIPSTPTMSAIESVDAIEPKAAG
jgi:S-adenosylmethionine hydrolase